jgi:nicotinate-nucleotide pyrophosphorylase (carboxylating)
VIKEALFFKSKDVKERIRKFLGEDIGPGDYSSLASIPENTSGRAKLIFKESGVVAGIELAKTIYEEIDPSLRLEAFVSDGDRVKEGTIGFHISGSVHAILKGERLVLNLMQRLSGIATTTDKLCKTIYGTGVKLLDTRKTTPGLRLFEKWAVTVGGGMNHRFGLYDMIMLKDNHVDYAGGIEKAVARTKNYLAANNLDLQIEVETRNLEEVKEVLGQQGVHRIMLDNFKPEMIAEAVTLINKRLEIEVSGGINAENLKDYALPGVDFISIGMLTHSVKSLDISLKEF